MVEAASWAAASLQIQQTLGNRFMAREGKPEVRLRGVPQLLPSQMRSLDQMIDIASRISSLRASSRCRVLCETNRTLPLLPLGQRTAPQAFSLPVL